MCIEYQQTMSYFFLRVCKATFLSQVCTVECDAAQDFAMLRPNPPGVLAQ